MHRHADVEENVNMKSDYLHMQGDLLGSVSAAALLVMLFGWNLADPIVSLFVALLIAAGGLGILQNTIHILMEGAPKDIDQKALLDNVLQIDGMQGVHDLHIRTLTSNQNMLSAHIVWTAIWQ